MTTVVSVLIQRSLRFLSTISLICLDKGASFIRFQVTVVASPADVKNNEAAGSFGTHF